MSRDHPMSKPAIAGLVAGVASWIAALRNTAQLEDKTWFVSLLVLGLLSCGLLALIAYVHAGPDSTSPGVALTRQETVVQ